ncbi:CLUMA_CG020357, isoform A [Clunio marinus]|uniref:CLUMA_CG020357, isoform A n=1 Tax=Clunio marinus TaxID=568069 RepID=A0A1J1J4Q0_9DIPT|nr:CLUMA_CG020357, isoform A [Clunio marinus]
MSMQNYTRAQQNYSFISLFNYLVVPKICHKLSVRCQKLLQTRQLYSIVEPQVSPAKLRMNQQFTLDREI